MAYQFLLPDIGEGVVEAEILKWFVAPGDAVVEDQPIAEVMTDKATVTIPSPKRGRVTRLLWKEGDVAKVHHALVEMELEAGASAVAEVVPLPTAASAGAPAPRADARAAVARAVDRAAPAVPGKALATPAVRALARELGVDLQRVPGSGPDGRVTKDDVRGAAEAPQVAARSRPAPAEAASAEPPPAGDLVEVVPVRGLRRRIAEKMAQSKRTAAHFTFVEQVDATELVALRDRMARAAAAEGVKVTFLPFVLKAAVAALRKFPQLNASFDEERGEIHRKRWYDLGIAAATDQGLTVPVVRGVDRRSIAELAKEIERLGAAARAGQLRPEDVGGSTFTVTSLGALGGMFATPVLNWPEVGILGIHRIRPTPVVRDGQVVVRDVMHVSLTSDHRVVDGSEAAAFTYE
ncbi:MAG TPA: dihydrolipoamide acetyltransferase family protein, partial [Anaeromyxobacteraceae bacterium]|nr:dihydrolipoamide acetyltransferase family protein [Anaeromyxobacteraceae bacterium]